MKSILKTLNLAILSRWQKEARNLFFLIANLLLIQGCTTADKSSFIPGYSGNFGELVVVCEPALWNSEFGKSVQNVLAKAKYGLPQPEPNFTLIQTSKQNFLSIFRTHRNVLFLTVDANQTGYSYDLLKSKWANGQVGLEVSAQNATKLLEVFEDNAQNIIETYNTAELNRLFDKHKKFAPELVNQAIEKQFSLHFLAHKAAELPVVNKEYAWVKVEREQPKGGYQHQISQGVLLFTKPYTDKLQFLDTNLNFIRDSIAKAYIPGPTDGSYLTTEYNFQPPVFKELNHFGLFAKEARGLWKMENNFMGGPFYFIAFLDEKNNRVVYALGYVFCPQFDKREYLREVEAMVRSIKPLG